MDAAKKQKRKYAVLGHIIHAYVGTALPVSSKVVVQRMGGDISSATIRNIMAELEDDGLIEHRHTSAGRIPTGRGYRHYVDTLTEGIRHEKRQAERLAREYTRQIMTIKEVIEKTTSLISRELRNAGIVMWPGVESIYIRHLQLVKLRSETILAVLVTMTNAVKNYIIKLEREMNSSELERISNYINNRYGEETILDISEKLGRELRSPGSPTAGDDAIIAGAASGIINSILRENIGNDIYWEGIDNFKDEPEFRDVHIAGRILQLFSEKEALLKVLSRDIATGGLRVYIGEESGCEMFNDCSIVTSGYSYRGRPVGRLGVIGLTRMDYGRALRTVSCLSTLISSKLEEFAE